MAGAEKFNGFKFDGPRIDDFDIPRIGNRIGVGEDVMHAVMDTETGGSSTDKKGRLKALYEPHVAYRLSKGATRDALVKAGLAYPKWKRNYPADSYPRILKAMAINESIALMATSWGFPQILGQNFGLAGYETVQAMLKDFLKDENNQIEAMINFIKNTGLDDELRVIEKKMKRGQRITGDDARPFVRGYNGPGYADNDYHNVFAKHANRWAKIKDTAWKPEDDQVIKPEPRPEPVDPHIGAAIGDKDVTDELKAVEDVVIDFYDGKVHPEVEAVQKRLDELGYPEFGSVDGKWGTKTRTAVLAFRADNNLPLAPVIDDQLMAALMVAKPRYVNPARANATVADLRKEGAQDVAEADNTQIGGAVLTAGGAVVGGAKAVEQVEEYGGWLKRIADVIEPVKGFVVDNFWVLALGVGAFIIWRSGILKRIRLEKHQTGKDVSK